MIDNKLLLFDLDGTLLDSKPKLGNDVQSTMQRCGVEILLEEAMAAQDWYKLAASYGISEAQFKAEFDNRKSWMQSLQDGEVPLFEDSIPCLDRLIAEGYCSLALVTRSKPKDTMEKVEYYGLQRYFPVIEITPPSKTDYPTKIVAARSARRKIGSGQANLIFFIGDAADDIKTADELREELKANADVTSIYVDREDKQLKGVQPDYTIKTLATLIQVLR